MIHKIEGSKNGYLLDETSTNDDLKNLGCSYGRNFRCLICNSETMKRFKPSFLNFGNNGITINNKLANNEFYVNGVY